MKITSRYGMPNESQCGCCVCLSSRLYQCLSVLATAQQQLIRERQSIYLCVAIKLDVVMVTISLTSSAVAAARDKTSRRRPGVPLRGSQAAD